MQRFPIIGSCVNFSTESTQGNSDVCCPAQHSKHLNDQFQYDFEDRDEAEEDHVIGEEDYLVGQSGKSSN